MYSHSTAGEMQLKIQLGCCFFNPVLTGDSGELLTVNGSECELSEIAEYPQVIITRKATEGKHTHKEKLVNTLKIIGLYYASFTGLST